MRYLFVLLYLLIGCTSSEIKRIPEPKKLIPEEKMVQVLKELTVMEMYVQQKYPNITQNFKIMTATGLSILKKHELDSATFNQSLDYYGSRQDKMQEIYSRALEMVNQELAEQEVKK